MFRKLDRSSKYRTERDHIRFVLYKIFIDEKRYNVAEIATRAGISASTIYKAIENNRGDSLYSLVKTLYWVTRDREFIDSLIHELPFQLIESDQTREEILESLQQKVRDLSDEIEKLKKN